MYIRTLLNEEYIDADSEIHLLVIYGALAHFTPLSGFYVFIIQNDMLSEAWTEYKCLNKVWKYADMLNWPFSLQQGLMPTCDKNARECFIALGKVF